MKCMLCNEKEYEFEVIVGERIHYPMCEECYKLYDKHSKKAKAMLKEVN